MLTIQFRAGDDRFPSSHSWEELTIEQVVGGYRFSVQGEILTPAQTLRCMECVGMLDEDQWAIVEPAIAWCQAQLA